MTSGVDIAAVLRDTVPMTSASHPLQAKADNGRRPRHLTLVSPRTVPIQDYVPDQRALHLVDIENQAGGAIIDGTPIGDHEVASSLATYIDLARFHDQDHMRIGCNPALVPAVFRVTGQRPYARHGENGADLALLDSVDSPEWIAQRYYRVVIGSGDGIFADFAESLTRLGVPVNVVGRAGTISRRFQLIRGVSIHTYTTDLAGSAAL